MPLDGRGFSEEEPLLHASYILAQVQDWPGVSAAVQAQSAWWEHAELCRRLVESGCRRGDRAESLTAWCYLCWLHPESALASLTEGDPPDRGIHALWQCFLFKMFSTAQKRKNKKRPRVPEPNRSAMVSLSVHLPVLWPVFWALAAEISFSPC